MFMIFLLSCTDTHQHSFIDFKYSFSQWNATYSPTLSFIMANDPLIYKKIFIGKEYISDIKRFLIELNQITPKRLNKENLLEYQSIKKFLDYNLFINETLNFNDWNAIYLLNNYHHHLSYIGKLVENIHTTEATHSGHDFLVTEIKFFNDQISFLIKNLRYRYNTEAELQTLSSLIGKIVDYTNYFSDQALEEGSVPHLHSAIKSIRHRIHQLEDWYDNEYYKLESFENNLSHISYIKYFYLSSDFKIEFINILNDANTALAKHENTLFKLSLPLYLKNNDEPVWTDFSDTVNVINDSFNTFMNSRYQCSDKDAAVRIIDYSIYELFHDDLYKNREVIFINSNQGVENNFTYYDTSVMNELYVYSSTSSNNVFENYYFTLMNLLPGDLFIYNRLKKNDGFNSNYLNRGYFYGFKLFLINYYLENPIKRIDDFELCKVNNTEYLRVMKLLYLKDRIIDCIGTIAAMNYFLEKKDVSDSIETHDHLGFIDEKTNNLLKEEIFGYKLDSIIKFISINKLQNLAQSENKADELKLLNILYENPNTNLTSIENIFNK